MTLKRRDLEGDLALLLEREGLPPPERQYRFAAVHAGLGPGIRKRLQAARLRDWRFDFAWPGRMVAAEVEGGIWVRGRHTRAPGFEADCEKYNRAALLGWTVLRFTAGMIDSGQAVAVIREALHNALLLSWDLGGELA